MEKLKCLAVDDEPHAIELLENYVAKVPFLEMVATTTSPWEAITILQQGEVDLLFLDIQMNELTGLQLLETGTYNCAVIITSAYMEYAIDGFNHQVTDYLLKPFALDRFLKAVTKVKSMVVDSAQPVKQEQKQASDNTYIYLKGDSKNKYHRVEFKDVFYIEGLKNYVRFMCDNDNIITLQNMKDLSQVLPENQFMRVHRSYIVNLDKIQKIDGHTIYMKGKCIPIGQNYQDDFYAVIKNVGLNSDRS